MKQSGVPTVAHRDLRNRSGEILRRVVQGESFQVTNRGEIVALLVPAGSGPELRERSVRVRGGFSALRRTSIEGPVRFHLDALRGDR